MLLTQYCINRCPPPVLGHHPILVHIIGMYRNVDSWAVPCAAKKCKTMMFMLMMMMECSWSYMSTCGYKGYTKLFHFVLLTTFLYLNFATNSRNLSLLWRHGFEQNTEYRESRGYRALFCAAASALKRVESGARAPEPDVTDQQNSLSPVAIALWSCSGLFRRNTLFVRQQVGVSVGSN